MRKPCEVCKGIGTVKIGTESEKCQNCDGQRWVGLPDIKPESEGMRQAKELADKLKESNFRDVTWYRLGPNPPYQPGWIPVRPYEVYTRS